MMGFAVGTPDSRQSSAPRIRSATDRRIDELVYELYGLSDKEVRIVEEATAREQ
ncbi:MAG: hypothetical protein ACYTKD_15105 [Planctomycetota bacterium]|jgi:hypothetical protein